MRILALDSTAVAASVCIAEDEKILGEFYINTKQTHSQTLMPMVVDVLNKTNTELKDIDVLAVSVGPGSFTGVRIGVACVKGMAFPQNKPCCAVSTLEAMARNVSHMHGTICAVMDARCGQVYNAMFESDGKGVTRITPDRAISIEELVEYCKNLKKPLILVGDGAKLCYNTKGFIDLGAELAPEILRQQHASGVAAAALAACKRGETVTPEQLAPMYLRLPQAQRELKKRLEGSK